MKTSLAVFATFIIFSTFLGCAVPTDIDHSGPLSSTDSLDKTRRYNFGYDQVFEAAFNAISKSNLMLVKVDKKMGAIIATDQVGSYMNHWLDYYGVYIKETKPAETSVQVKLINIRPGSTYALIGSASSPYAASFGRVPLESNLKKVNSIFTKIQSELGIEKKFTIRGLLWD